MNINRTNIRKTAGRTARLNGYRFEELLTHIFAIYANSGIMKIDKAHENLRPVSGNNGGYYKAVFCKSGQPDFRGCTRTGRCVVFEAKHTSGDKINSAAVTQGEENNLDQYAAMNALTGVLVQYGSGKICFFPWIIWKNMRKVFGHVHIKESEAGGYAAEWIDSIDDNVGVTIQNAILEAARLVKRKEQEQNERNKN